VSFSVDLGVLMLMFLIAVANAAIADIISSAGIWAWGDGVSKIMVALGLSDDIAWLVFFWPCEVTFDRAMKFHLRFGVHLWKGIGLCLGVSI
jgi:hypothetical protein